MTTTRKIKSIIGFGTLLLLCFSVVALWRWSALSESLDVDAVSQWLDSLKSNPHAPYIVIGAFLIGSQIMFPITALILASAYVFGPWQGFVYGMVGSVSGALLTYSIGYFLGHDTFRYLAGRRFEALDRALREKGMTAVLTTHLIPIGPFTIVNLAAGVVHVRLWDFFLGCTLGLFPGVALTAVFEHQLEHAFRNPETLTLLLLLVLTGLIVAGLLGGRRLLRSQLRTKYQPYGESPAELEAPHGATCTQSDAGARSLGQPDKSSRAHRRPDHQAPDPNAHTRQSQNPAR
jgi:phospholipase D1/2